MSHQKKEGSFVCHWKSRLDLVALEWYTESEVACGAVSNVCKIMRICPFCKSSYGGDNGLRFPYF